MWTEKFKIQKDEGVYVYSPYIMVITYKKRWCSNPEDNNMNLQQCENLTIIQQDNFAKFGQENRDYGRRDPSRWPRGTLYPQKLALTSPTSGGRSFGIVRSQTQATEFVCFDTFAKNNICP
jgi:hypothetical protein